MGTDLKTTEPRHNPPGPVPRSQIIGLPAGRLKDASGAAARPDYTRSLTRPAARHGHGSYQGTRRRQSRTPVKRLEPHQNTP